MNYPIYHMSCECDFQKNGLVRSRYFKTVKRVLSGAFCPIHIDGRLVSKTFKCQRCGGVFDVSGPNIGKINNLKYCPGCKPKALREQMNEANTRRRGIRRTKYEIKPREAEPFIDNEKTASGFRTFPTGFTNQDIFDFAGYQKE